MGTQTEQFLTELSGARCAVPFQYLGLHERVGGKGLVLRAFQPAAAWVEVVDLTSGDVLGRMRREADSDLFLLNLPDRSAFFPYQLRLERRGQILEEDDPYQFRRSAFATGPVDHNRLYRELGAHKASLEREGGGTVDGVLFAVYAPHARRVSLVGPFNEWDGRRHPMQSSYEGTWRLFVPGLAVGSLYKYEISGPDGEMIPLKTDPFARFCEQPPGNAAIVHDEDAYAWSAADERWCAARREGGFQADQPLAIYEVHPGSWRRKDGRSLSYRELADELTAYVRDMGFTHIELMPVMEHPFEGSWGYQVTGMFAPTSRFGPPDDFKYFVDRCHEAGIGVIVDWVPAHFPADDHGLGRFDGTPLYEHSDPRRGWHPDWDTYIYDFGRWYVRDFLVSSAMFWVEHFHVDGIRVDAVASMLYLDYSRNPGEWTPNMFGGRENLEAIDFIKRMNETLGGEHPGVLTIAEESTAWPGVSRPTFDQGLGFGFKWNMGWMHDTLSYMSRDPVHRRFHHGDLTFGMVYAYDERFVLPLSHDEVVYGKGSLLGKMPGDDWQKYANLRLYYGFMYAHPGKKLLFMGCEIGQVREWNHDGELDWFLLENAPHEGLQTLVRDLNRLYAATPALFELDDSPEGFEWLDYTDADQGVVSFVRYPAGRRDDHVIVVSNLTPVVRHDYRIGVPGDSGYEEVLNTDSEFYGGSNVGNAGGLEAEPVAAHGRDYSLSVTLPPLATVYLKPNGSGD